MIAQAQITHAGDAHGRVWLVGAGPGDEGLITVAGLEALRAADVVVHDRLIGPGLLRHARADAELIDAGKLPSQHTLEQDAINALIVARAARGQSVVRLKGGDPLIFGRGWEELLACERAGVSCRIIPGVTSAIAAPAAAGVPVTLRGVARTLAIVTPQVERGSSREDSPLDYAALARMDTVCVLMGRSLLAEVAAGLIGAGKPESTPVAVIENGTLPTQRTLVGTLGGIAEKAERSGIGSPAVIVVGEVAALAGRGVPRPGAGSVLSGKRIVVTRPRTASASLIRELVGQGASVIDCPAIRIEYVVPEPAQAEFVLRVRHDWAVFTSLHGVRGFWRLLRSHGLDARFFSRMKIAAVGPKTGDELRAVGVHPDLVPKVHRASALIEAMRGLERGGVLFPCGTLAREELACGLRSAGFGVRELAVYDTLPEPIPGSTIGDVRRGADAVVLYSPSAALNIARTFGADGLGGAAIACIGPTTADAARQAGLRVDVVATDHTDAGLIEALGTLLGAREGATA